MPILLGLLVLLLPARTEGLRSSTVLSANASLPKLRIHAVSFNAGNRIYDAGDGAFIDLVSKILPGHDVPGHEADIVLLGFQEFEDNAYLMGHDIRVTKLWTGLSERKVRELDAASQQFLVPPAHVHEAAAHAAGEVRRKQEAVQSKYATMRAEFGEAGHQFHNQLVENTPVNKLINDGALGFEDIRASIEQRLFAHESATLSSPRFHSLTKSVDELAASVHASPSSRSIQKMMRPVQEWAKNVTGHLSGLRARYPNLDLTAPGELSWKRFLKQANFGSQLEYLKKYKLMRKTFLEGVALFKKNLIGEVESEEAKLSKPLLDDWKRISKDFQTLQDDLDSEFEQGHLRRRIVEAASRAAATEEASLQWELEQWTADAPKAVEKPGAAVSHDHVDVQMEPQKFNSGISCQVSKHLDTVMYAFVNPWSGWRIQPVEYSSKTCRSYEKMTLKNFGCNIDNSGLKECGKVVNLQVFELGHSGTVRRLCALNTHMSFKGNAEHRMNLIAMAMMETKVAGCETVVFVGDFNTRLHCGEGTIPPFDRGNPTTNSFDYILSAVCRNESPSSCSLKESGSETQLWDEMTQILKSNSVDCFEQYTKKGWFHNKKKWRLVRTPNHVSHMGLREADVPPFPPSYKLAPLSGSVKEVPEWRRCNPEIAAEACFVNPDRRPKHNPAWTDRILVKAKSFVTREYSRRMINASFGTDHAPVVALLDIDFNE